MSNHSCVHRIAVGKDAGFSLIEMMVAIVIGILLSIGLIQIMVAGKTASQVVQGASFMQENARFATSQLDYSLQMADHWGPSNPDKGQSTANSKTQYDAAVAACAPLTSASATGENWWTLGTFGVSASSSPASILGATCIPDYQGGDVIVVRYADSNFLHCSNDSCSTVCANDACSSTTPIASAVASNGLYVRVGAGQKMVLARGDEIANLASATYTTPLDARFYESPDHSNQDGLYTFPYRLEIFYIRKCSTLIGGVCTAASDNNNPIPTLWRVRLDNVAGTATLVREPVVEGVQTMQFEYGLASNDVSSGAIPARFSDVQTYKAASALVTTDWLKVVSVRVGLLAQSDSFNSSGTRGNIGQQPLQGAFIIGADTTTNFTPSTTQDKLLQHAVFTTLGQVRNRERG